jgi:ABC-type branched-subunit amino acid transport system substrate-binding protein
MRGSLGRFQGHLAATIALVLAAAVAAGAGRVPVEAVTPSTGGPGAASQVDAGDGGGPSAGEGDAGATVDALGPTGPTAGSGTPSSSGGGGPARIDPGITDTEIHVGGSTFTSGPAAVYGEQIAVGFTAGVQYVNDHGGVNGRKLVLTLYDDGGDPAKQLANTKRLLEVDKVFALTMVYAATVGDYVASQGVPVVHLGQFDEEFTNPWWFPLGGPQRTASFQLEHYVATTTNTEKVAIFYLDAGANNFSAAYAEEVRDDWAHYGIEAPVLVPFAIDQTSCSDAISQASAAGVDFIQFEIDAARVINCGIEAQIQGYEPPEGWGGYLIGVPVVPEALGSISEGMIAFDAFGALYDVPDYERYVERVSPRTEARSSVTMSYFLAALLLRDGLEQLGDDLTRANLQRVLNTFTDWRPGLTDHPNQPTWTWTPTCHTALKGGYVIEVQDTGGSYRWEQISEQLTSTPLPPGKGIPPGFESCGHIFRTVSP